MRRQVCWLSYLVRIWIADKEHLHTVAQNNPAILSVIGAWLQDDRLLPAQGSHRSVAKVETPRGNLPGTE